MNRHLNPRPTLAQIAESLLAVHRDCDGPDDRIVIIGHPDDWPATNRALADIRWPWEIEKRESDQLTSGRLLVMPGSMFDLRIGGWIAGVDLSERDE